MDTNLTMMVERLPMKLQVLLGKGKVVNDDDDARTTGEKLLDIGFIHHWSE